MAAAAAGARFRARRAQLHAERERWVLRSGAPAAAPAARPVRLAEGYPDIPGTEGVGGLERRIRLIEFWELARIQGRERALAFDVRSGQQVFSVDGGIDRVEVPLFYLDGAILTHNHPAMPDPLLTGYSFSFVDLELPAELATMGQRLVELRMVCTVGATVQLFRARPGPSGWPAAGAVRELEAQTLLREEQLITQLAGLAPSVGAPLSLAYAAAENQAIAELCAAVGTRYERVALGPAALLGASPAGRAATATASAPPARGGGWAVLAAIALLFGGGSRRRGR